MRTAPAASRLRLRDRYQTHSQEAALMTLVGCDLHSRKQQVAVLDTTTGEIFEQELAHDGDAVERFYRALRPPVTIGIETTGYTQWFHALMHRLGHTVLVGEAGKIRAMVVRKTKTDRRDARHLLDLLKHERFPTVWMPDPDTRDLRALVAHRVRLVRMRTMVKNGLPAIALNQRLAIGSKLWTLTRFPDGKHVVSYVGLAPSINASANKQHLGKITKQGNALLRWVLGQAAPLAARADDDLRRRSFAVLHRRGRPKARVALARKLLVRLYVMLRDHIDYDEFRRRGRAALALPAAMPMS